MLTVFPTRKRGHKDPSGGEGNVYYLPCGDGGMSVCM